MARPATLLAAALALCLLPRGLAWYKPAAGPGHYSVGRAAGLLSGLRRAPHARRSDPPRGAARELREGLRSLAVCVRDVSPNLRSCERLPGGRATFQCRADVLLSLRAADCRGA
ncbi:neuropeptide B [Talpa occidentalis]|uniref:neuropeptide B n=1 Tax=Talpa occidentalis TaxID=50954 RepID=UPI00188EA8BA|nr:neuropeptide B [Talpa occidentalis]